MQEYENIQSNKKHISPHVEQIKHLKAFYLLT